MEFDIIVHRQHFSQGNFYLPFPIKEIELQTILFIKM